MAVGFNLLGPGVNGMGRCKVHTETMSTSCSKPLLFLGLLLATSTDGRGEIRFFDVNLLKLPGPGSLATVYCTGLEGIQGLLEGSGVPLPTLLGGVRVNFGAVDAPLLAVKDVRIGSNAYQQINFQVPYGSTAAPRIVQAEQSAAIPFTIAPWGEFFFSSISGSNLLAQHAVNYRPVTFADPPQAGEWIIIYGTNFGAVEIQPQSGVPAPTDRLVPLSNRIAGLELWNFRVHLDSLISVIPLEVGFLGLAPGKLGIYQLNVRMPDPLPRGPAWIYMQRIANCGERFNPECGLGLRMDSTAWEILYK